MSMRVIHLKRADEGRVAEGVEFTDGRVVLKWLTGVKSTEFYESVHDLRTIREASGRSRVVLTDLPAEETP